MNFDVKQIVAESGVDINLCYQCKTCSLGCPFAGVMDILPHKLIRMIQTNRGQAVLASSTIWRCAACETCVTRCPNGIDIPTLMDWLRQAALHNRIAPGDRRIALFHKTFLDEARIWGRQYELGMLLKYKLRSKDLFSDISLGLRMILKRKLPFLPGTRGRREMKNLLNSSKTH